MLVRKENKIITEAVMSSIEENPAMMEVFKNLKEDDLWTLDRILYALKEGLEGLKSNDRKEIFDALSRILVQHKDMDHLLKVCKRKYPFETRWW